MVVILYNICQNCVLKISKYLSTPSLILNIIALRYCILTDGPTMPHTTTFLPRKLLMFESKN